VFYLYLNPTCDSALGGESPFAGFRLQARIPKVAVHKRYSSSSGIFGACT